MNPSILHDALRRLDADFQFKKEVAGWLRQGTCPNCHRKSVYARAEAPWVLRCERPITQQRPASTRAAVCAATSDGRTGTVSDPASG